MHGVSDAYYIYPNFGELDFVIIPAKFEKVVSKKVDKLIT